MFYTCSKIYAEYHPNKIKFIPPINPTELTHPQNTNKHFFGNFSNKIGAVKVNIHMTVPKITESDS